MVEELLERIPPEKCWEITTKILWKIIVLRGDKSVAPLLGKGEGIFAPVMGAEKWREINEKVYTEAGKHMYPWLKETFNIAAEDPTGASKLGHLAFIFSLGPESTDEIVELTPERIVFRQTKCVCWDTYEEFDVHPELRPCDVSHELIGKEGLRIINPNIVYKVTKARPRGDPYCEDVFEFKEE
jgi:hypothetical protein